MNISLMRFLDRYVGIFLCLFLSFFSPFLRFIPLSGRTRKKILLIELSEMGSLLLTYPALKSLKDHEEAEFYFLTFEKNKEALFVLDLIPPENILTLEDRNPRVFLRNLLSIIKAFRDHRFDSVIDMELFSRLTCILSFLTLARIRIAFQNVKMEGLFRGNLITHPVHYNPHIHMSLNYLALTYPLLNHGNTPPYSKFPITSIPVQTLPDWDPDPEILKTVKDILRHSFDDYSDSSHRLIILKPSGGLLPIRAWPSSQYLELIRKLLNKESFYVILVGTPQETQDHKSISARIEHSRFKDLTGTTSFRELLHLLSQASCLITNDGGPAHFSSLTKTPSVVFYGPETPALYSPIGKNSFSFYTHYACSPCLTAFNQRQTACTHNQCLQDISVETAYSKIMELLSQPFN